MAWDALLIHSNLTPSRSFHASILFTQIVCFKTKDIFHDLYVLDCGRVYGAKHGPAVHIVPPRRTEEQPALRGPPPDSPPGNEPHVCSTGTNKFRFFCVFF